MSTTLITVSDARALVLGAIRPLATEEVGIDHALGRVLAQDLRAAGNVPPFPCSAMDGYAILAGPQGRRLRIVGESRAGGPSEHTLADGEAIRISTGAAVPAGATAVIPQENVNLDGAEQIDTGATTAPGENIREAGEDMRADTEVLGRGARLESVELGAATAAGVGSVIVARQPRVAVLCTGDELRAPGEPLNRGEIHNSNAPMLTGLTANAGGAVDPAERLPDDRGATEAGIAAALERADVVIISGGVSVGPHDHVKPALATLGVEEVFWSVSLQPGKPTWFGTRGENRYVFGLPGNPVSAVVTFSLFVAPALSALQGARYRRRLETEALLGEDVKRNKRREQAVRVRLMRGGDVPARAFLNGAQGSHILTSLLGADALAMIPAGQGFLPAGTRVTLEELAV
jgi:molybdopterin molybdotransferase